MAKSSLRISPRDWYWSVMMECSHCSIRSVNHAHYKLCVPHNVGGSTFFPWILAESAHG
jgi:hypothetical protein